MRAALEAIGLSDADDELRACVARALLEPRDAAHARLARVAPPGVVRKVLTLLHDGPASPTASRYFADGAARDCAQYDATCAAIDALAHEAERPLARAVDALVVGAGVAGLAVARALDAPRTALVERDGVVGGVWRQYANATSRVNTSEPAYRLADGRPWSNHSRASEVLLQLGLELRAFLDGGGALALRTEVRRATPTARGYDVHVARAGSQSGATAAELVVVCTNRRLGVPRAIVLPDEARFRGRVLRGIASDVARADCADRDVVIVGMGAFAIETMRTCLERRARHVAIVCRRRGAVCPHVVDWVNFVRPFDDDFCRSRKGDAIVLHHWALAYDASGASKPECWREGLLKPDGHTVSVSDLFFVAHRLRRAETHVAHVRALTETGLVASDGRVHSASLVVACVGFETNDANGALLGHDAMRPSGLVDDRALWLLVESHLDAGALSSPFGSSYASATKFLASLLVLSLRDPSVRAAVAAQPRNLSVARFGTTQLTEGLLRLARDSGEVRALLRAHLRDTAERFHSTMSVDAFVEWNKGAWRDAHALFGADETLAYPFDALVRDLGDELRPPSGGVKSGGTPSGGTPSGGAPLAPTPSPTAALSRAAPPSDDLRRVLHVLSDATTERVDANAVFADLLDSIASMEFRSAIERAFDVALEPTALFDAPTPSALVELVRTRRAADEAPSSDLSPTASSASLSTARSEASTVLAPLAAAPRDKPALGAALTCSPIAAPTCSPIAAPTCSTLPAVPTIDAPLASSPHVLRLHRGRAGGADVAIVVMPSTWGTVAHYRGLARKLDEYECFGLEHPHLRDGGEACLSAVTLLEQAWQYAALLAGARAPGTSACLVGGSLGATFAHGVAACATQLRLRVPAVVMLDPPPLGPGAFGTLDRRAILLELVRMASEVVDEHFDRAEARRVVDGLPSELEASLWATAELTRLGMLTTSGHDGLVSVHRRLRVYEQHLRQWARQPSECHRLPASTAVAVLPSTGRREFYSQAHGEFVDDFDRLGETVHVLPVARGAHTAVIQGLCTGRRDRDVRGLCAFVRGATH